jgi:hypothetical protein
MSEVTRRDLHCVGCDARPGTEPMDEHHRILGNTADERPSVKLLLCGRGNHPTGPDGQRWCHGSAHTWRKAFGDPRGYIVSRHADPAVVTLTAAVWYQQPSLGRVGWYALDDDGGLRGPLPLPAPPDWEVLDGRRR